MIWNILLQKRKIEIKTLTWLTYRLWHTGGVTTCFLCIMGACQVTAFWYVATKLQQDTLKNTSRTRTRTTSSLSRSHSHIFVVVQTRIIHNFISALRSTYRVQTQSSPPQDTFTLHTSIQIQFRFESASVFGLKHWKDIQACFKSDSD